MKNNTISWGYSSRISYLWGAPSGLITTRSLGWWRPAVDSPVAPNDVHVITCFKLVNLRKQHHLITMLHLFMFVFVHMMNALIPRKTRQDRRYRRHLEILSIMLLADHRLIPYFIPQSLCPPDRHCILATAVALVATGLSFNLHAPQGLTYLKLCRECWEVGLYLKTHQNTGCEENGAGLATKTKIRLLFQVPRKSRKSGSKNLEWHMSLGRLCHQESMLHWSRLLWSKGRGSTRELGGEALLRSLDLRMAMRGEVWPDRNLQPEMGNNHRINVLSSTKNMVAIQRPMQFRGTVRALIPIIHHF